MTTTARLASRLAHLAEEVAESYCVFAASPVPEEPKAFAAHHAACKAALAHLDLLLRLIRSATPTISETEPPMALIIDARRALTAISADIEMTAEQADAMQDLDEEDDVAP